MDNREYTEKLAKRKINRIMAWIGILLIVGLIVTTIIFAIIGSELFLPFMVLSIIVPVFIYVIVWLGKVLSTNSKNDIE